MGSVVVAEERAGVDGIDQCQPQMGRCADRIRRSQNGGEGLAHCAWRREATAAVIRAEALPGQ